MEALRIAYNFVRVPRLFLALLMWPLAIGLLVASGQIILTAAYVKTLNQTSDDIEQITSARPETLFLRKHLYDTDDALPQIKICRWSSSAQGSTQEVVSDPSCTLDKLDLVIHAANPQHADVSSYADLFNGSTYRLHVCKTCTSDLVIDLSDPASPQTHAYSLWGFGVFVLKDTISRKVSSHLVDAYKAKERIEKTEGTVFLHPRGYPHSVNFSTAEETMVLILNVSLIIVITLWLALKAHRKILDYFAENDALLPLVAACGKSNFYRALWIITAFRVSFFLLASVPATFFIILKISQQESVETFLTTPSDVLPWLACIISSLTVITIIASIGELKRRHHLLHFLYTYLPLAACFIGTVVWIVTVFEPGNILSALRNVLSVIPVIGTSPIILAPLFKVPDSILFFHTAFCVMLIFWLMKHNAKWFGAHLEEL